MTFVNIGGFEYIRFGMLQKKIYVENVLSMMIDNDSVIN